MLTTPDLLISHDVGGRYRIIRRLAHGGMGVVYEAEQVRPLRTVALKVVRTEAATEEFLARFTREARALARLRHPGFVQIYDVGTIETPVGPQPFLAMELIRGEPLTRYAEERELDDKERVALFLMVCDAVTHMHSAGVIHRDLKPDNILVDERGQPRIIDFGVALLADAIGDSTVHTTFGQLLGTMAYMSPEQAAGDPTGLDERSDVYSLGVILFELLARRLPYVVDKRQLHESLRAIRECDPPRLGAIDGAYAGDIETIVAKALQKERSRRYQSAGALAADLRRHESDLPVEARRPSALYRARKFTRRHRALAIGAGSVMLVLVIGVVATTAMAVRATQSRLVAEIKSAEAVRQSERAKATADFLQKMLLSADPAAEGRDVRVVDVLKNAEWEIESSLAGHGDLEGDLRETIGAVYHGLGLYPEARAQLERALALLRAVHGDDSSIVANATHNLATVLMELDELAEAETLLRSAIEGFRRTIGPEDPATLRAQSMLGMCLLKQRRTSEAAEVIGATLELQRRTRGDEHADTLNTLNTWAGALGMQERWAEAADARRDLLEASVGRFGDDHPQTLAAGYNLARLLQRQARHDEAATMFDGLVPRYRRVLGARHPLTLGVEKAFGHALASAGRKDEGEAVFREALRHFEGVYGSNHPETISMLLQLAVLLRDIERLEEAEVIAADAALRADVMSPPDPDLAADARLQHGRMLTSLGRFQEAEAPLRAAHAAFLSLHGAAHPRTRSAAAAVEDWEAAVVVK